MHSEFQHFRQPVVINNVQQFPQLRLHIAFTSSEPWKLSGCLLVQSATNPIYGCLTFPASANECTCETIPHETCWQKMQVCWRLGDRGGTQGRFGITGSCCQELLHGLCTPSWIMINQHKLGVYVSICVLLDSSLSVLVWKTSMRLRMAVKLAHLHVARFLILQCEGMAERVDKSLFYWFGLLSNIKTVFCI